MNLMGTTETSNIAVIGIGKLGLCFSLMLERADYNVLGIDQNQDQITKINNRSLVTTEPGVEEALRNARRFSATTSYEILDEFDASIIFIAVATPSLQDGSYDHNAINEVLEQVYALSKSNDRRDVVVICTTMPGYCDTIRTEARNKGVYISYNPEFIAQGSIIKDLTFPDQLLIGEADTIAGDKIVAVYNRICMNAPKIFRMSPLSAEITKLATNCFLTMKIAFANSIGDIATIVNAEPDKILAAVGGDSRINSKYLNYGFGFGGPCFPRDNSAMDYFTKQIDYALLQCAVTDEMNRRHLEFQVQQSLKRPVEEQIRFNSVTYKPHTTIIEESQQLKLAVALASHGRKVLIQEHPEVIAELKKQYGDLFDYAEQESDYVEHQKLL